MKKLLLGVALIVGVALAADNKIPQVGPLFESQVLSTNATSRAIELHMLDPHGYYSIQVAVAGTGTLDYVQCEVTNDESTWIPVSVGIPDVDSDATILTNRFFEGYTTNSGPNSDGTDHMEIGIPLCREVRFRIYGTGGVTTNSLYLTVQ